jgi:hypothetical protein
VRDDQDLAAGRGREIAETPSNRLCRAASDTCVHLVEHHGLDLGGAPQVQRQSEARELSSGRHLRDRSRFLTGVGRDQELDGLGAPLVQRTAHEAHLEAGTREREVLEIPADLGREARGELRSGGTQACRRGPGDGQGLVSAACRILAAFDDPAELVRSGSGAPHVLCCVVSQAVAAPQPAEHGQPVARRLERRRVRGPYAGCDLLAGVVGFQRQRAKATLERPERRIPLGSPPDRTGGGFEQLLRAALATDPVGRVRERPGDRPGVLEPRDLRRERVLLPRLNPRPLDLVDLGDNGLQLCGGPAGLVLRRPGAAGGP